MRPIVVEPRKIARLMQNEFIAFGRVAAISRIDVSHKLLDCIDVGRQRQMLGHVVAIAIAIVAVRRYADAQIARADFAEQTPNDVANMATNLKSQKLNNIFWAN